MRNVKDWECLDCGGDTFLGPNYYMVYHSIWAEKGPKKAKAMICWHCMEVRLGRPIGIKDLLPCILNLEHVTRLLKRNVKMDYKELLIEKTKIRMFDTKRYNALTMILNGAAKRAKTEMREVVEGDILASVKSLIKANENVIELIESKQGDASEYRAEIQEYEKFLPKMYTQEQTEEFVTEILEQAIDLVPEKKSMGKYMARIKSRSDATFFNMGLVSKILQSILK